VQPTVADERRGAAPVVGVLLLVALTVLLGATVAFTILGGPPEGRTGTYAFTTTESGDALVFTVEAAADPQELIVSADGTEIGRGTPSAGEGIRVTDLPAGTTVRLVRETGGRSFGITEATAGRQFGTGTTPRLTTGGVEFHAIGETGRVDISADAGAQTLRFDRSYDNPIVVVKPLADGGDPAHVRVRDVTSTSAQVNV
jgi:flagellin-like protein